MISLIFLLGISVFLVVFSLLVLLKNYKNKINLYFAGVTLSSLAWFFVIYFEDAVNLNLANILVKLDIAFAALMSTFLFLVFLNFPTNYSKKLKDYYLIFPLVTFLILDFFNLLIVGVELNSVGGVGYVTGPLYPLYIFYIAALILGGFFILFRKFIKSSGQQKAQIQYVLVGGSISAILMLVIDGILPRIIEVTPTVSRIGIYSSIFFIFAMFYAIVRHRLMDIRMVVARSVAYVLLLVMLAGIYAAAILAVQSFIFPSAAYSAGYIAVQIGLAILMAFSFQPLRRWITKITDKIFFKNAYDPEQLLDTISHTLGQSIVLIELLYKTLNLITSEMKITRGQIIVLSDTGKVYTSQSVGYAEAPKITEEDIQKMVKDGVLVYDELEENSHYKRLLRKLNASIAVPLKTENDTEGLLILGEKLSGDMYSAGDLRVFEIIAPELAVAINNAKSFEKIERFNVTLREEVKKATAELEKKNQQLMELDKAKDEFISMASHQLRTPLTAIKGYLSMLLEGDAGEIRVSQYDFVNEAFNGANRMVGLINDLLNVSRMETGRFFLEPVEVDLDKLVQEEIKQLQNHAKEKHLYLKYECKGKVPHVWADETKIRQVVMNFIDNAVYYTNQGGVTVKLSHDAKDVIFEVSDTGIGVPKTQQKNLFTKFYRADNARHVRPDGTGLGIYLAKRVLDDHKAELLFKSKEGEGSTFGFRFPIKSKLSTKRVTAPVPGAEQTTCPPAVGELAAGIGVSPQALEATQTAGIEKPLSDSADAGELSKQAVEMSQKASTTGSGNSSMPAELVKSAEEAIETMRQAEVKKEEAATK